MNLGTIGVNELKRELGLEDRAFKAFCERTGLAKIPDSDKYNLFAVEAALELDGYAQIIKANLGDVSEERAKGLRILIREQGRSEPIGLPKVGREIRLENNRRA